MKNTTFRQRVGIFKIVLGIIAFNTPFAAPLIANLLAGGWQGGPTWIFIALLVGGVVSITAGLIDYFGWSYLRQRMREEWLDNEKSR